jgi:hypothetical protein
MGQVTFEYDAIRAKTQQTLIEFIKVELELGHTFTQSATLAKDADHADHYEQAKQYAIRAAECVNSFATKVLDDKIREDIEERLAELERAIAAL